MPALDWVNGKVALELLGFPGAHVVIFPKGTAFDEAANLGCSWPVSAQAFILERDSQARRQDAKCVKVLDALWSEGGEFTLAGDKGEFYGLQIAAPTRKLEALASGQHSTELTAFSGFFYQDARQWQCEQGSGPIPSTSRLHSLLQFLPEDGSRSQLVYYELADGSVALVNYAKRKTPNTPLPFNLSNFCDKFKEQEERNKGASSYVVCLDVSKKDQPRAEVRTAGFNDPGGSLGHLWTNIGIKTFIWYRDDQRLAYNLSGTAGLSSTLYIQSKAGLKAGGAGCDPSDPDTCAPQGYALATATFGPRTKAGAAPVLTTAVTKTDEHETKVGEYKYEFVLEQQYEAAIRTGIAALYGWRDRKYSIRAGSGDNAANQIVLSEDGVVSADLTVGLSLFAWWCRVGEFGYSPCPSLYVGLTALSSGEKGIEALTALMVGPELSLGKDFSIAAVVALRRSEALREGYSVGSTAPSSNLDDVTRFSLTPAFGVMLNLSPMVLPQ